MSTIPPARFLEVFQVLSGHIEDRYGLDVRVTDVPDPFTGDLDGTEIQVDYAEDPESALFILVHLFGHTVQWNRSQRSRELSQLLFGEDARQITAEELDELQVFEKEACQLSLQLLHDAGIEDLDQWVADYAACDYAYLMHVYETGERPPFKQFWKDEQPLLEPLSIPDFHPHRWITRSEGIVV